MHRISKSPSRFLCLITCCPCPINCLQVFACHIVCTEILHYELVHVRWFVSGDKMKAVIVIPDFVDPITYAIKVGETIRPYNNHLLAEDKLDLEAVR